MDTEEFTVSSVIPASPNRIYSAWMDERHHSAFTGTRATVDPWVGGRVVSDDGFIDATHVYLVTGSRIAMTWRTRDFPKGSNDSHVNITFEPVAGGTKIEVTHSKIPPGLGKACEKLWKKLYLDPMTKYFGEPEAMLAAYKAAKKAGHLPLSGIKASRPAPRRPIVTPAQLPVEEVDEEEEEEKPKKIRKRIEAKTVDLRELAQAQAEARKAAVRRKAEVKRKAEALRRQAEAAHKKAEAKKKAELVRAKKAEAKRKAAEKKKAELEKKKAAANKKAELARKKAAAKKKADVLKRKKAAAKKKADALKRKKAAAKKATAKKKAAAKKRSTPKRRGATTKKRSKAAKKRSAATKKRGAATKKRTKVMKKRAAPKKRAKVTKKRGAATKKRTKVTKKRAKAPAKKAKRRSSRR